MSITVEKFKPLYTTVAGDNVHFMFSHKHFSIVWKGLFYEFVPFEGKEIIVNVETGEFVNTEDVLVFQNGHRFIRFQISKLILMTDTPQYVEQAIKDLKAGKFKTYQNSDELKDYTVEYDESKIVRIDLNKQRKGILSVLIDRELGFLSKALKEEDEKEVALSKERLKEYTEELKRLEAQTDNN